MIPFALLHPDTFVVIAAYNEAAVIRSVVEGVLTCFSQVIVVDDGSRDGTTAALEGLPIHRLRHPINLGQGAALQTGLRYALDQGAAFIITFDGDGQHRPQDALGLLERLRQAQCDVVLGSRFLGGATNMPRTRRWLLQAAVLLGRLSCATPLSDAHNGLRGLNQRAARSLHITQHGMAHASQIISQLSRAGLHICEAPVTIDYTSYSLAKGQSSLNAINILVDLLVGRFTR